MENMEAKDIITTEAVEELAEAIPAEKNGLKTAAKAGLIMVTSIVGWELAVKPLARKLKSVWEARKAKKAEKTEADETDEADMDLDEIPEIED